jgi:hypothetical protein
MTTPTISKRWPWSLVEKQFVIRDLFGRPAGRFGCVYLVGFSMVFLWRPALSISVTLEILLFSLLVSETLQSKV